MYAVKAIAPIALFFIFVPVVICQKPGSEVLVKSWATENAIREDILEFKLIPAVTNRFEYITTSGYRRYKLSFRFGAADQRNNYDRDKWQVVLQEVLSTSTDKKEKLGCNLLLVSGCGRGGDYFPKEDSAAILFPTGTPNNPMEKIVFGQYYPMMDKRVFWVKTFLVTIKVADYNTSDTNPKKLDFVSVTVSFRNILNDFE